MVKIVENVVPLALSYDDVLLVPQYSNIKSRKDVDLTIKLSPRITLTLPITSAPMSDVTGPSLATKLNKMGGLGYLPRFCSIDEEVEMVKKTKKEGVKVGAAVGCKDDYIERATALVNAGVDVLLMDIADGHLQIAIDATEKLKERFNQDVDIHSGLVATRNGAEKLFAAGADCVHVGIGGGSICTTRIMTGCGIPNITSILDCAPSARKLGKTLVVDAGAKNSGDIVKACAAGASAVRAGFMLAGFDESPGKVINSDGTLFKMYKGSTSKTEKSNHVDKGLTKSNDYVYHVEGVESKVTYKGSLEEYLKVVEAGVRSGFSYCGAKNINELWENAEFVRITPAGMRESRAHDVVVVD